MRNYPLVKRLDSMSATGKSAACGLQALAGEILDYSYKSFENGRIFVGEMLQAKSPDEFSAIQSKFARGAYELLITKSMNLNELSADLANQTFWQFTTDR